MKIPKPRKKEKETDNRKKKKKDLNSYQNDLSNFKKKKKVDICALTNINIESVSKKIDKLIEDLEDNFTGAKFVVVLAEIAQRPEGCFDFKLTFWLDRYLNEVFLHYPNFTEAAYIVGGCGIIYGKRVNSVNGIVTKSVLQSQQGKEQPEELKKQAAISKGRKTITRPLTMHDRLYEADMLPKKFKTMPLVKTTEALQSLNSLEVPKHYFQKYPEYKEWRKMYKKRMKNPIPYSVVGDDSFIHPSMWKLSCIEDYDYDDDKDTKRSYRMFTNYIEPRYSTLVPDINFILHFKVKDFIEAEEDEIEMMKILGLPTPPIRTWPPFCKMSISSDYVQEHNNIPLHETNQDYIKTYIALEDIVLKQGFQEVLTEVSRQPTTVLCGDNISDLQQQYERVSHAQSNELGQVLLNNYDSNSNINTTAKGTETIDQNEDNMDTNTENVESTISESCLEKNNSDNTNLIPAQNQLESSENIDVDMEEETNTVQQIPKTRSLKDIESEILSKTIANTNSLQKNSCISSPNKRKIDIISVDTMQIDTVHDILKLNLLEADTVMVDEKDSYEKNQENIDEGIWFSELDDVDREMLCPVVKLTDILKQVDIEDPTAVTFQVDSELKNMFAIDEIYLTHNEDFKLPSEILVREVPIIHNMFKFPEKYLRKKLNFTLPIEYDGPKQERIRKRTEARYSAGRIKLYKLNQKNFTDIFSTPRASPDFLGFEEETISFDIFNSADILSSTMIDLSQNSDELFPCEPLNKRSRLSHDSGIGLSQISIQKENSDVPESMDTESCIRSSLIQSSSDLSRLISLEDSEANNETGNADNSDNNHESIQDKAVGESNHEINQSNDINIETVTEGANVVIPGNTNEVTEIERLTKKMLNVNTKEIIDSAKEITETAKKLEKELTEKQMNEFNAMNSRVQIWHRHLKPILANSHDTHHFDMFDIGTEIMDKFEKSKELPVRPITLENVMYNKNPNHKARFFLAALQLTNSENIELDVSSNKNKPTSLKDIRLKLISRERHVVAMEDNVGMYGTSEKRHLTPTLSNEDKSNEVCAEEESVDENASLRNFNVEAAGFIKRRGEEDERILQKYKEANREKLSKEVNAHRDDYIRLLSKKHDINLGLYYTPERSDIIAVISDHNSEKGKRSELVYPGNMRSKEIQNAKRFKPNADDSDSGIFSQSTASSSIAE